VVGTILLIIFLLLDERKARNEKSLQTQPR